MGDREHALARAQERVERLVRLILMDPKQAAKWQRKLDEAFDRLHELDEEQYVH